MVLAGCQAELHPAPEPPIAAGTALSSGSLVAHAFGGIDGNDKTNCFEAWEECLEEGKIWVEADFQITSDGVVVLAHPDRVENLVCDGWEEPPESTSELTAEEFLDCEYLGQYSTMTLSELLEEMVTHDHIRLITDTRGWTAELAQTVTATIEPYADISGHVVPQIYHPSEAEIVAAASEGIWSWDFMILTLYMWEHDVGDAVIDMAFQALEDLPDVSVIVMWDWRVKEATTSRAHSMGRLVGTHTINEPEEADELYSAGADIFYTDELPGPSIASSHE